MTLPSWIATSYFVLRWVLRLGLMTHIILKRRPVATSLAWLSVILLEPIVGAVFYAFFGENRLGRRRLARFSELAARMEERVITLWRHRSTADPEGDETYDAVASFGTAVGGLPPLRGNRLKLMTDADDTLRALIADIDAAKSHCHVLTYIWLCDGEAARVGEALIRAAGRGVACRALADAVGSKGFFRSDLAARMRAAGVEVVEALPVNAVRMLFARIDLRNHRKIAVIDGRIAYAGSQNITGATFTPRLQCRVGPWIDAMVRVEGPAAQALAAIFMMDWQLDSGQDLTDLDVYLPRLRVKKDDLSIVQVVPSGPGDVPDAIHKAMLTTIYAAREELIITTPYFVPDEAMLVALQSAAMRGVRVTLVLPEKCDTRITTAAGRAHYVELLEAGVRITHFRGGLLHAKTMTVDRNLSLVGSANLDMRSFWLNFEVTLFIYDNDFTGMLRFLQTSYIEQSEDVVLKDWRRRPRWRVALENAAGLLSPLL